MNQERTMQSTINPVVKWEYSIPNVNGPNRLGFTTTSMKGKTLMGSMLGAIVVINERQGQVLGYANGSQEPHMVLIPGDDDFKFLSDEDLKSVLVAA